MVVHRATCRMTHRAACVVAYNMLLIRALMGLMGHHSGVHSGAHSDAHTVTCEGAQ